MDAHRAVEELARLEHEVDQVSELMALKPIYYQLETIAKEHLDNAEVQSAASALRQHILSYGKRLKEGPGRISSEFPPVTVTAEGPAAEATTRPETAAAGAPPAVSTAGPGLDGPSLPPLVSSQMPAAPARVPVAVKPPAPAKPVPVKLASPPPPAGWKRAVVVGSVIGLAAFGAVIILLRSSKTKTTTPPSNAVAVEVHTVPPGASILINNVSKCVSDCRVDLTPGTYQVQAQLPGYEPAVTTVDVAAGASPAVSLTLSPMGQAVRLSAELESGTVTIDDKPAGELQGGQFVLDRVPPGKHTLKVTSRTGSVAFSFECAPGSPATLSGQISSSNLLAIVLSGAGPRARLYGSNTAPVKVALDGKPAGAVSPSGLDITGTPGDHELTWGEGKDQRKLQVNFSPAPVLIAFLKADVNAGTLIVNTGEDGVAVFLNGKPYRLKTQRGQLRILLGAREYAVRVAKEGYQDEPEQKVQIGKGEELKVEFKLRPVPKVAALQLRGAPAGAVVSLGRDRLPGAVGPDGSFSASHIPPGDHVIEIRKEQYLPKRVTRSFRAGETVTIEGADVALEKALATLKLSVQPADARVTIRRSDETQARPAGGTTLQVNEGSYVISATAANHQPKSATVSVASGETKTVELVLTREAAKEPVRQAALGMGEWEEQAEWTSEGAWTVRKGGNYVLYRISPANGTFSFNAALLRGRRLQWVVDFRDAKNHALYQLERKQLIVRDIANGKQTERAKVNHPMEKANNIYTLQIEISNGNVTTRIYDGQSWVVLDSWSEPGRNFTLGKFGLFIPGSDQYGLSGFKYTPR